MGGGSPQSFMKRRWNPAALKWPFIQICCCASIFNPFHIKKNQRSDCRWSCLAGLSSLICGKYNFDIHGEFSSEGASYSPKITNWCWQYWCWLSNHFRHIDICARAYTEISIIYLWQKRGLISTVHLTRLCLYCVVGLRWPRTQLLHLHRQHRTKHWFYRFFEF